MSREGRASSWLSEEYRTPTGISPMRGFLASLDGRPLARAVALLRLLAERGNQLRLPASRSLGGGLFELRDAPSGVRMFYVFGAGHRIVLLDGMVKKRDDVPGATLKRLRGSARCRARAESDVEVSMAKNGSLMDWVDSLIGERELEAEVDEALHEFRLADDLVRLREARGLSQRALAQRLGISQPAVAKIESGRVTNLQLRTLLRIVTVLGGKLVLSVRAQGQGARAASLPVKGIARASGRRRAGARTSGPRSSRQPSGIES